MYAELFNFNVDDIDQLINIISQLHQENSQANLNTWIKMLSDKFNSLVGISDLNGDDFDSMLVQLLLLHSSTRLSAGNTAGKIISLFFFLLTPFFDLPPSD